MLIWLSVVALFTAFYLFWSIKFGPAEALAIVIPASWLLPAWAMLPLSYSPTSIVATGIDIKVSVTVTCLVLYCFIPGRTFPVRFVPSDYAMLGLFITHLCSDIFNDGWRWSVPGRAYAEWYLPYVAGRISLQSWTTIQRLWRYWAVIPLLISLAAIYEGLLHSNPYETLFGVRPYEGAGHDHVRWGMRRAYGPTMNPIYLGVVQLLLSAWILHAALRAMNRRCHWIWALMPGVIAAGIVCTGSRGPIFGMAFLLAGALYFRFADLRRWMLLAAGLSIAAGFFFVDPIIRVMDSWSGESHRPKIVKVDGKEYALSNASARLLLFEINKIAFKRSGLLGFGTESVSGFPVNVPVGAMEAEALRKVWTIENTYALLLLRFGYLGLGMFGLAALLALNQCRLVADRYVGTELNTYAISLGASIFAVLLVQATVWMPHEIGFPLVYFLGLSAGLAYADRSGQFDADLEQRD